jgi:pimeloyl-ACP methyl ester carboxylesterase
MVQQQVRLYCYCMGADKHGIHGWVQRNVLAQAGYRVISVDARGHGDSAWADDGDYSADTMVGDLRCIIEQLDAAPILVGASNGRTNLDGCCR